MITIEDRNKAVDFYIKSDHMHDGIKKWIETGDKDWIEVLGHDMESLAELYGKMRLNISTRKTPEMVSVQENINQWRLQQFPDATLHGADKHLKKEINEALEELADVFFLSTQCEALGGVPMGIPELCWRMISEFGFNPEQVILAKLAKNKQRDWPKKPADDGCYHHQKEASGEG